MHTAQGNKSVLVLNVRDTYKTLKFEYIFKTAYLLLALFELRSIASNESWTVRK
jgi:hypothetical protein